MTHHCTRCGGRVCGAATPGKCFYGGCSEVNHYNALPLLEDAIGWADILGKIRSKKFQKQTVLWWRHRYHISDDVAQALMRHFNLGGV